MAAGRRGGGGSSNCFRRRRRGIVLLVAAGTATATKKQTVEIVNAAAHRNRPGNANDDHDHSCSGSEITNMHCETVLRET